jgi:predicted AAA+ superfamily ATPase
MERTLVELLEKEHFAAPAARMAFVTGPRQCGKTTLARMMQENRGSGDLYRNWDDLSFRKELAADPYGFMDAYRPAHPKRPLAVLDEIHKFPRWKTYLKGLWDTRKEQADILVTGSGRLDIYQRGGDSLFGRYHQYRLHPLSLSEILGKNFSPDRDTFQRIMGRLMKSADTSDREAREAFTSLLRFGGFPEPFLAQNARRHRLWLREKRELLTRQDLRDLTRIQMLSSIEQMVELLIPRAGSLLSLNNLRQELGVTLDSVRLWMSQLERLYYCYRLTPYAGKLARSLRREPKLFLYDWSEIPEEGKRFENMMASALLRWCDFAQDWGQEKLRLHFIRDKEKREVDFLLTLDGKPQLLVEAKLSHLQPSAALQYFAGKLGGIPKMVVVANASNPGTSAGVRILPASIFLSEIP